MATTTDNNYSLDTHTKWHFPTLININARSLSTKKIDELQAIVDLYNVSIVCITETWFKEYIGDESVSLYGYNLERKDRTYGRAGRVACYVRNDVLYKRLDSLEVPELEVIWIKIMPKKLPRKVSCILVACVYYTQHTDYSQMRYHLIMGIDTMIRKHPECRVIITGDFNQLNDNFLKVHYRFVQVVNVVTRGQATLDKIWTNMNGYYSTPVSISELGTSDHCMVLWKPEKAAFAMGVASIRWEPLFRLTTCEEKYSYYQTIVNSLMEHCFPIKTVTRHTADKPWITDMFRNLIRKRQRAYKSGNRDEYRVLRNMVNRESTKLKFEFYQKHILAISKSGSRDWWENMKKIMGLNGNSNSDMEELAKKTTDGDFAELANIMNDFFSVCE